MEDQVSRERTATVRKGCLATGCIVILLMLSPFLCHGVVTFSRQINWWSQNIDDYTITVVNAGYRVYGMGLNGIPATITVRDGQVVEVDHQISYEPDFSFYQQFTVDGLFAEAYSCVIFCSVTYDTPYGYPSRIGGGFIEGGWVDVIDFQPLSSEP